MGIGIVVLVASMVLIAGVGIGSSFAEKSEPLYEVKSMFLGFLQEVKQRHADAKLYKDNLFENADALESDI